MLEFCKLGLGGLEKTPSHVYHPNHVGSCVIHLRNGRVDLRPPVAGPRELSERCSAAGREKP